MESNTPNLFRFFLSILLVQFAFTTELKAQTCGLDTSLCYSSEVFPSITFGIQESYQTQANTVVFQTPLVIDINQDCKPELIFCGTIGYTSTPRQTSGITIANSSNGTTISSFPTYLYSWTNSLAYAAGDLYNDGVPELIIAVTNHSSNPASVRGRLVCYDFSGNVLWISDQQFGLNTADHYDGTPALADFNGDGIPEVYLHNQIFNAQTGVLLTNGNNGNGIGVNTYYPNAYEASLVIAGDLDNNPADLELAAGFTVYDVTITNTSGTGGNNMIPHSITVDGELRDGYTSLADINLDGKLDVIVSSPGTETSSRLYAYYLDASLNPVLIARTPMPRATAALGSTYSGPPYIGDIDGNGTPSICVTRNYYMLAYQYNGSTNFQQKWILNTVDQSGCTGITSFDFDQDGIQEIVFRDENNLQIIHGNGNTATSLSSINCASLTFNDMPIVADVDNSGQARICVTCGVQNSAKVIVYGSNTTQGWAPARGIWNQFSYHVNNVEDDGSIPVTQQNGTASALMNNFFVQSTFVDETGNYLIPAADVGISIDCITSNKVTGLLTIAYTVTNDLQSSKDLLSGYHISAFGADPLTGALPLITTTVNSTVSSGQSNSGTMTIPSSQVSGPGIFLLVNHSGGAISGTYDSADFEQIECDYTNNTDYFEIVDGDAGIDLESCTIESVQLNPSVAVSYTGSWQVITGTGTFSNPNNPTSFFTPSASGNHVLEWRQSSGNCIVSIDQMTIVTGVQPFASLPDMVLCMGDTLHFGFTDPDFNYEWTPQPWIMNPSIGMPFFFPEVSVAAEVTATNPITGCIFKDTFQIDVADFPQVTAPPDMEFCAGQTMVLTGQSNVNATLTWDNGAANPLISVPDSGPNWFVLQAISIEGCISYDSTYVFVYPSPSASFTYTPQTLLDEQLIATVNHSENAVSYSWSVNATYITDMFNMLYTTDDENETGYEILLVVSNEFGCVDTAKAYIKRIRENYLFVPNTFTPDGNERNNVFFPVFMDQDVQGYKLEIFDRWGELIFQSTDAKIGWDGTYSGKIVKEGLYNWKLVYYDQYLMEKRSHLGHVNLLR